MSWRLLLVTLALSSNAYASPPACASWPTNMAMVYLKNAGIAEPTKLDEGATKATMLAAQSIGKGVYKEIYDIVFREKTGKLVEVVTSNEASEVECSLTAVDVYVVSRRLGGR